MAACTLFCETLLLLVVDRFRRGADARNLRFRRRSRPKLCEVTCEETPAVESAVLVFVEPTRARRSTSAVADDVLDDDDDDTSGDNANSIISKVIIARGIGFLRRLFDLCSISGSADWVEKQRAESEKVEVKSTRQKYKNTIGRQKH